MRTRAFLDGAAFGYFNQAIIMLTGLWLTPFLLKHLGQSDYGGWLECMQILGYAMLADFGTVAILPREIAYTTGGCDPKEKAQDLNILVGRTARVVIWQTALVLVIAGCILLFSSTIPIDFRIPTILVVIGFVVAFPFRIFAATLEGFQRLRLLGQIRSLVWLASTLTTVVAVFMGARVYSLAVGWLVGQVGSSLACYFALRRLFPWLVCVNGLFQQSKVVWTDLFKGTWISVQQLAQVLVAGTDLLIVGHVLGPAAVVVYSCTNKLLSVLANQPIIILQAALPGLSQMKVSESREQLLRVSTAMGLGMMLISGAVASLVLCLNKPFVILWVGSKIFGGNSLTLFFIANTIVRQLDLCFVVALFAFGYEKQLALKSLADGVLSTALAFALSRLFGAYGVVGSYLLTAALFAFPASLYLLSRECGVSPVAMVKPFFPWCWRFALLAALFWKVSALGWINSYPKAAFAALGILLVYTLVMSTCLKKSELWPYIEHLIARIQRIVPGFGRLAPGTV